MKVGKVRLDNIKKVQRIWMLANNQVDTKDIAKEISRENEFVHFIIQNTYSKWYQGKFNKESYIDSRIDITRELSSQKVILLKAKKKLNTKKSLFINMAIATLVIIALMIAI